MSEALSEEKATAILLANLKGAKKKSSNLIEVARACRLLIQKWGIGRMSDFFRVSQYQIRQIDKINDLNPDIQRLISNGKLGIDASYQIWRLDEKHRSEVAKQAANLSAHEIRQLVYLLLRNPTMSTKEAKNLSEKALRKRINLLLIPLTSETYRGLKKIAKDSDQNIHDLALKVLEDYINEQQQK